MELRPLNFGFGAFEGVLKAALMDCAALDSAFQKPVATAPKSIDAEDGVVGLGAVFAKFELQGTDAVRLPS